MIELIMAAVITTTALEVDVRTGAQMCVGETGWNDAAVCAAQAHVIRKRAARRGWTFARMARAYSRALRVPRRAWVTQLRDTARQPADWPSNASWRVHRPKLGSRTTVDASTQCTAHRQLERLEHFGSARLDGVPTGFVRSACFPGHPQAFYERGQR
ncbi:MAG: hypothetical protein AAGE52_01550 [Myxococcota bacterium]